MPRIDLESRAGLTQALGERLPRLPLQHDAKMRHGNVVAIHLVVVHVRLAAGIEMRHDLVPEEIEIHPLIAAAALGAAEQAAVELARGAQRVDGNGEMKGCKHGTIYLRFHHSSRARTARSGWSERNR